MMEKQWLSPGDFLDNRYRITQLIKAGGMGAVYQAQDAFLDNKLCAVKQMLERFDSPSERRQSINQFLSEIQVLAALRHPNIPKIYDHFMEKGAFYFVMEFISGIDLSSKVKQEGKPGFTYQQVAEWMIQVLSALEYTHALTPPVSHRDIKPSNLLLRERDNRILLIDFGIARVLKEVNGFWIGTLGYAPPEQQMGKFDPRSDFYALGATIYHLLTGHHPEGFEFPPLSEAGVEVPKAVDDILYRALQWNPDDRYQTASVMKADLAALINYQPELSAPIQDFNEKAEKAVRQIIIPTLKQLIERYKNECTTKFLPCHMDYLVVTLGFPVPFEFIVRRNENTEKIEFFEKQGILEKTKLGEAGPEDLNLQDNLGFIVERFVDDYETFKGGGFVLNS